MKLILLLLASTNLILLLLSPSAHAYQLRFGTEVLTQSNSISDVKFLSVSKEFDLKPNVFWKIELGYWADKRKGASNSFILNPGVGLVINPFKYFDIRVAAGLSAISSVDKYLGSYWNFTQELFVGFKDGDARIGLTLNHVSCGCDKPNIGRNFVTLTAGYGF